MTKKDKERFMREAMLEGRKALPNCRPNPPVGCVIVKNGEIISRGHTNEPGHDHAEARALRLLGDDFDFNGVYMFVTLEPCSFFGRTPSCAKNIVRLKIPKVFVAILDPHPKNQGTGIKILKDAGVEVEVGILQNEVAKDLAPFLIKKEPAVGELKLSSLLRNMTPTLNSGEYVFASVSDIDRIHRSDTICEFKEKEGVTVVLEKQKALELDLPFKSSFAWITLEIHSSLDAVGLTAAFSKELAEHGISCNVIAGYFHDHIFVGIKDAEKAIEVLKTLSNQS